MAETARGHRALVVTLGLLATLLVGWPLARLAGVAAEGGIAGITATLSASAAETAIFNSLWSGALVALLAVAAGTSAAFVTERANVPGRWLLRTGMLLPLLVPPFVNAYGWTRAFGSRGLLDQLFGISLPGLYGSVGIVLVLAVASTPLAWLVVAGALASRVEPDLERAARASGAGPLTTLRTVTLPLLRPSLLSATVIVFVFALNAFGVPAVLGTPAGFTTITTLLYQDLARSADPAAFVQATTMALSLVLLALVVVGSSDALLARRPAVRTALPAGAVAGGRTAWVPALVLGAAIAGTTILPLGALLLTALTRAAGLAPVPANWTLANFGEALNGRFFDGLAHSLLLATLAATLVLVFGALAAGAIRGRSRLLAVAITIGFAVPGSALAVAVLLAWGGWLRDSLAIILVAYLAKFWALGHRQLAGSIDRLPADQLRAARASGAGPLDTLRSVAWPILRPSVGGGLAGGVRLRPARIDHVQPPLRTGQHDARRRRAERAAARRSDGHGGACRASDRDRRRGRHPARIPRSPGPRPAGHRGMSRATGVAVACLGVSIAYGPTEVVRGLDLEVQRGEMLALLGPSGSGKTTMLSALAGFIPIRAGTMYMAGRLVADATHHEAPERRDVAVVFQSYALWPHLTALETVAYPLRRRGVGAVEARRRAEGILERLGIAALAGRRPAQLSGGEQQRVGLGRALAREASLYLFDEPTAHLDAELREHLGAEIAEQRRRAGAAAIYATHDTAEALALADRVALVRDGRVVQDGSPAVVYDCPVDMWAARLTGPAWRIGVRVVDVRDGHGRNRGGRREPGGGDRRSRRADRDHGAGDLAARLGPPGRRSARAGRGRRLPRHPHRLSGVHACGRSRRACHRTAHRRPWRVGRLHS